MKTLGALCGLLLSCLSLSAAVYVGIQNLNGHPCVSVSGPANTLVALERSADLRAWQRLGTNLLDGAPFTFTDERFTSAGGRFYRAVLLPPPVPTGLAATFEANLQTVNLSWSVPVGTHETHLERRASNEADFEDLGVVAAPANHWQDGDLESGLTYTYRVSAGNGGGQSGSSSAVSVAVPYLGTPVWQSAVYDGSNPNAPMVRLSWSLPAGTEAATVERSSDGGVSFKSIDSVSLPDISTEDSDIEAGKTYLYRLIAEGPIGDSEPSSPVSVAVPYPLAPTWRSAVYDGSAPEEPVVRLGWTLPAGAGAATVERSSDGGASYTPIDSVSLPATSTEDSDLKAGKTYLYRLIAEGSIGDSEPSSAEIVSVPSLSAPTILGAASTFDTNVRETRVDLSWTIPAGAGCVTVERRASNESAFEELDDMYPPDNYYQDTVTEAGKTFIYRLVASNAIGDSPAAEVSVAIPVPAPLLEAADTSTPLEVDLSWSDDLDNETQYELQRINPGGGTVSAITGPDESWHTSAPPMGYTYTYRVRVMAGGVWSPFSNEVTATPHLDQVSLVTPADGATGIGRPTTFTWAATPSAYKYRIEIYQGSTLKDSAFVTAPTRTYTSAALVSVTTYKWRVRACTQTGTGNGAWSDWFTFKTR